MTDFIISCNILENEPLLTADEGISLVVSLPCFLSEQLLNRWYILSLRDYATCTVPLGFTSSLYLAVAVLPAGLASTMCSLTGGGKQ